MLKILIVLLWPAAIAAILCGAAAWSGTEPSTGTSAEPSPASSVWARRTLAGQAALDRLRYATRGLPGWGATVVQLAAILAIGALAAYGVMALLGLLVVHNGHTIDKPIYHWTIAHRIHAWASVNKRLTKIGDTWTTWGAAATAAVCLAVSRERRKWLPALVLAAVIVLDHFLTLGLRETFGRPGPPNSPGGTYPSGGCDRVIFFYGTIAYLLWRQYSGRRRTAIWASAAVLALAFNEAYTRLYLTLHWFTDVLSGLLYGGLLLAVLITAIQSVDAPTAAYQSADATPARGAPPEAALAQQPGYVAG